MRDLFKRDQRVVVTRGYLMAQAALPMMMAGLVMNQTEILPVWIGLSIIVIGVAMMLWCLPHAFTAPKTLDQDQSEARGRG